MRKMATALMLAGVVAAINVGPIIVGIISIRSTFFLLWTPLTVLLVVLALFAVHSESGRSARLKQAILAVSATSLALTLVDVLARPVAWPLLNYRPTDMFIRHWDRMPILYHYDRNTSYRGETYGDLAAISGWKEYREYREVIFETDGAGYRNREGAASESLDVIILGDSFGAGAGTTQGAIMAAYLEQEYKLAVYNLSVANSGPWQQYATLVSQIERLETQPGTVVIWLVFNGNDLEDLSDQRFGPLDPSEFELNNWLEAQVVDWQTFRYRSPIRLSLDRIKESMVEHPQRVTAGVLPDGRVMLFYTPYIHNQGLSREAVEAHPYYERMRATIGAMSAFAKQHDLRVALVLIPDKSAVYSWALDGQVGKGVGAVPSGLALALEAMVKEGDQCFVDLTPHMIEEAKQLYAETGELLWWPDDSHWNGAGHRLAAQVVRESPCLEARPGQGSCCRSRVGR